MKIGHTDFIQSICMLGTEKSICIAHLETELKSSPCILLRINFFLINIDFILGKIVKYELC